MIKFLKCLFGDRIIKKIPRTGVKFFAEGSTNCSHWTVQQCLEYAYAQVEDSTDKPKRCLIILIDGEEINEFQTHTWRAGLTLAEEYFVLSLKAEAMRQCLMKD